MQTVVVAAAILVEHDRVLVTRRKAGTHLGGTWEFPGGKLLAGEDPREGLRRELREEIGVDVDVGDIVDVAFHRYTDVDKAVLLLFFEVTRVPGSPDPRPIDVADLAWAVAGDLDPARFPPADLAVLRKVKARFA